MGNRNTKLRKSSPRTENSLPEIAQPMVNYVALYEYNASGDGDIGFRPGDYFITVNDHLSNEDWLFVKHEQNGTEGYVPRNYVAKRTSLDKEPWYFGKLSRIDIKNMFSPLDLTEGTFLVREQIRTPGQLALTVKFENPGSKDFPHFRSYQIKKTVDDCFYIAHENLFPSLKTLLLAYQQTARGLCCKLSRPFPKIAQRLYDLSPRTQDNYEIQKTDLKLFEPPIGSGNSGLVYFGLWKNRTNVAVKCLKINAAMSREKFLEEARIMKECRHENLVSLLGVCSIEEPIYIITEYMCNGDLLTYLQKNNDKTVPFTELIEISRQIANGMAYLEQKSVVHRDLAARNCLVGKKVGTVPTIRISDFGMAKMFDDDCTPEYEAKKAGEWPIKWMAPESLMQRKFSIKSDVWSFGVLLYEIFTRGGAPYPNMLNFQVPQKLWTGYRMPWPNESNDCNRNVYEIMLRCWKQEPERRDTFEFLYSFFENYFVSTQSSYSDTVD